MLGVDTLSATIGREILTPERAQTALRQASPKASGTLASHYAPNARLRLLTSVEIEAAAQALTPDQRRRVGVWSPTPPGAAGLIWRAMPADPAQCAQALFQTLRSLEDEQVKEIWVHPPPAGMAWDGIRDRLTRASHGGDQATCK